jgi:hypothetical protein
VDLAGLFIAISAIGVAWVNAYYGFRNTQETARREARGEDEKYRLERLKEQDQLYIEPLRQQISDLRVFTNLVAQYYLFGTSDTFSDEEEKAVEVELVKSSGVVYQYDKLSQAFANYYPDYSHHQFSFQAVIQEAETVLNEQRENLSEKLREAQSRVQIEPQPVVIKHDVDDGPLIKVARQLQQRLRDVLRLR